MNRKAQGIMIGVFIGAIIVLGVVWMMGQLSKECRKDKECGENYYCGSDFQCHEFKVVEKNVVQIDFVKPTLILAAAIIIAVVLYTRLKK